MTNDKESEWSSRIISRLKGAYLDHIIRNTKYGSLQLITENKIKGERWIDERRYRGHATYGQIGHDWKHNTHRKRP